MEAFESFGCVLGTAVSRKFSLPARALYLAGFRHILAADAIVAFASEDPAPVVLAVDLVAAIAALEGVLAPAADGPCRSLLRRRLCWRAGCPRACPSRPYPCGCRGTARAVPATSSTKPNVGADTVAASRTPVFFVAAPRARVVYARGRAPL